MLQLFFIIYLLGVLISLAAFKFVNTQEPKAALKTPLNLAVFLSIGSYVTVLFILWTFLWNKYNISKYCEKLDEWFMK